MKHFDIGLIYLLLDLSPKLNFEYYFQPIPTYPKNPNLQKMFIQKRDEHRTIS